MLAACICLIVSTIGALGYVVYLKKEVAFLKHVASTYHKEIMKLRGSERDGTD